MSNKLNQSQTKSSPTAVPSGQSSILQRKCACGTHTIAGGKCNECKNKQGVLQRKSSNNSELLEVPPIVHEVLQSSGQPLDKETRAFFETRFTHDFSNVRVHTDAKAAESAQIVHALAYTVGKSMVFGRGQYAPKTVAGKHLLAHELTHIVQQRGHQNANFHPISIGEANGALESEADKVASRLFTDQANVQTTSPVQLQGQFLAPPPQSGGFSRAVQSDWRRVHSRPRRVSLLNFFHGTSWNIARQIIGNVQPQGGGDFAAGFYTHYDRDSARAMARASRWGVITALRQRPPERYAGLIQFDVRSDDFHNLLGPSRSRHFGLYSLDQPDYQERQREWLEFVTSHGRNPNPTYRRNRLGAGGKWIHERRDPQPHLGYNIITGPFYAPRRGTSGNQPGPDEFQPYAEGRELPQQVVWANDGIALLNSSRVNTHLYQYDANNGRRIDPPVNAVPSGTPPPTRDVDVLAEV